MINIMMLTLKWYTVTLLWLHFFFPSEVHPRPPPLPLHAVHLPAGWPGGPAQCLCGPKHVGPRHRRGPLRKEGPAGGSPHRHLRRHPCLRPGHGPILLQHGDFFFLFTTLAAELPTSLKGRRKHISLSGQILKMVGKKCVCVCVSWKQAFQICNMVMKYASWQHCCVACLVIAV